LEVIARLDWPAAWVKDDPNDYLPDLNNPPDDVATYARFVAAVASHFRGRVRFYQIWNEPNLLSEWGNRPDRPVDPVEYVAMLAAASRAAREADPNAVILSAPLAFNTETIDIAGNMNDLDYLEGMYEAGASEHFDILSANAFGMDRPPEDPPSRDVLNFRRVELQREIMEAHGDGDKPIWFAEYGWNAAPADLGDSRLFWRRVSEGQQAAWTVGGVEYARRHWPWAGVFSIWYFRKWAPAPDQADYYFRMVDTDFTPRRVFGAVQEAAGALEVAGPGEWSESSSPVRRAGPDDWTWIAYEGALDGNALESAQLAAQLTFTFRGSRLEARLLGGPDSGEVGYQVDGRRPLTDPPSTLDLGAEEPGWQWHTLADALDSDEHVLRLTTSGESPIVLDGFRVADGEADGVRTYLPYLLAALAVGLATVLAIDVRRAGRRIRL
jgi:hypothetical protein